MLYDSFLESMGVPGLKSWVLKKCSPKRVSLLDWAAEGMKFPPGHLSPEIYIASHKSLIVKDQ